MSTKSNNHYSVMLTECLDGLNINPSGIYVDCTMGRAGHSSKILEKLKDGKLFAFDQDQDAIDYSKPILEKVGNNFEIIKSNFRNITEELNSRGINKVDGILIDLGVSSPQLDNPERGFSYRFDSRLDMRMDMSQEISAYTIVNEWDEKEISKIIFEYGEEKFARQIARKIVETRVEKPIETTFELIAVIRRGMPAKAQAKKHPAKKVFQAIRIAVNDELNALRDVLTKSLDMLDEKGRLVVLTFHSLEDRITKVKFKEMTTVEQVPRGIPVMAVDNTKFKLINKKPIMATEDELENNRRSLSAKLRIIERK